ncbi:MAG: sulfotransferase [Jaaginema sp. PMC 1079.18]|nr:sulfotransferase [Jaaginema sp. PMC 1080.18]MEC4850828.1 sulfotransferase [Jaaginema sp. PMC 1079.18]MEC4868374.1 sulfotransferase [Jaaginema sp. PMC 1078.18]
MKSSISQIPNTLKQFIIDDNYRRYLGSSRVLPNFLIVGAQKAGTTSLYAYLKQHPQVLPAQQNEVHFFDYKFNKGELLYRSYFPTIAEIEYQQNRLNQKIITGETSPSYLFNPLVASRIAKLLPTVKIIILLRDPVTRSYSHYQHEVRKGRENLTFAAAIAKEEERVQGKYHSYFHACYAYQARGLYLNQIKTYLDFFKPENILILSSENFFQNPQQVYNSVLSFLELAPFTLINQTPKNVGTYNKKCIPLEKQLRTYFQPHNCKLYQYLNRNFGW